MMAEHIYPYFKAKGIVLSKVRPMDLHRYHCEKLESGLFTNTVIKHHAIIRSALQYAVKNALLKENVADVFAKLLDRNG